MGPLTLRQRAEAFAAAFPDAVKFGAGLHVAPHSTGEYERFTGIWLGGQNYKNASKLYGALPPYFLPRVFSMFPDARRVLHVFSGSLTKAQVEGAREKAFAALDMGGFGHKSIVLGPDFGGSNHGCLDCGHGWPYGKAAAKGCTKVLASWRAAPLQIRFDNALHPAAKAAQPDVIGDAEQLAETLWVVDGHPPTTMPINYRFFDLVVADPPYRLADQRRYWRESMWALPGRCSWEGLNGWCSAPASAHAPVYRKSTREGALIRDALNLKHELQLDGYQRFKPLKKSAVLDQIAQVTKPGGYLVWLDEQWPNHSKKVWRTVGFVGIVRSTQHRTRFAYFFERVG